MAIQISISFLFNYLLLLLVDFLSRVGEGVDEADDRKLVRRIVAPVGGELDRKFRLPRCAPLGIILNNGKSSLPPERQFYTKARNKKRHTFLCQNAKKYHITIKKSVGSSQNLGA